MQICFGCGQDKRGAPAADEPPLLIARRIRKMLRLGEKRTVACAKCLPALKERRLAFEKRMKQHQAGAVLFCLLVVFGSVAFGRLGIPSLLAAVLGSAFMLLLPYAYYCPKFK